jgi:hypothetical protein
MKLPPVLFAAASNPAAAGAVQISLTDALLILVFAGLLVAAYQMHQLMQRLAVLEARLKTLRAGPESAAGATPSEQAASDPFPPEHLAAIAAASHVAVGQAARVVAIAAEAAPPRTQTSPQNR